MKLTFLGTGTSTGVPQIGCRCSVCRSTDPRDKRLRTSAIVETDSSTFLIDCGPDFRSQILRSAPYVDIDALLVTHEHYDHLGGLDDLRPYCTRPGGMPIFCRADVADTIRRSMPYCFGKHHYPGSPVLNLNVIDDAPFQFADTEIIPLPLMHAPTIRINGYRIGNLAYITDCKIMPHSTLELIRGVDALVINALRIKEHPSHINLTQALAIIAEVKPRKAYLTHISHDMGLHDQVNRTLPAGVEIAYDGMQISIP